MRLVGQVIHFGHVGAVELLPEVLLVVLHDIALEPVGPAVRLNPIGLADQPGQSVVRHRNVQVVGIVVAHVLPVDGARAVADIAHRLHVLKPVLRDFGFERGHHFADRGEASILQTNEDKAVPHFDRDGDEAVFFQLERRIFGLHRNAGKAPVGFEGPGVIGADQLLRATRRTLYQTHRAMAADVGEGPDLTVIAADHDDTLTQIVERAIVTGTGNLADMADDLPRWAEYPLHFQIEEFAVVIDPARQAEIGIGIDILTGDFRKGMIELGHRSPANP